MRKYITVMLDKNPTIDWEDLLPSMMLSYNCHVHRATGDSPFFLKFAHDLRLPYFDIEKPRMFYDSSYVSDMYEISRAAHKAAKENLEEQARQARGLLLREDRIQNVRARGPSDHILSQPAARGQPEISYFLENIYSD
jgi:hypothetical protein